jgi:hypothetical protein
VACPVWIGFAVLCNKSGSRGAEAKSGHHSRNAKRRLNHPKFAECCLAENACQQDHAQQYKQP